MPKTSKKAKPTVKAEKAKTKGVEKKTAKVVEEVKTVAAAKEETKKITAAKEPEKITTAKEPEKITAAKEPEKITAAKEPEKIEEKKVEKIETKEAVKEAKPAKKTTKKATAKKESAKKEAKTPAKKTTKKTVAAEEKTPTAVKEEKKPAAKKQTAKKTTKKASAKASHVKEYEAYSLDDCIAKMQTMGVQYDYNDYTRILLDEADDKVTAKNIIEGNGIKEKGFTFEKDGCDEELVLVVLNKVKETMDIKAADFKEIKKDVKASMKAELGEDAEANASEYLKEFKLCEKILMLGQRKNIISSEEVSKLLDVDVDAFIEHFFNFAYGILPGWQYDDVKFYEDFAYAVLSQYTDLYTKYQLRVLIDVADLYIKHGDFQHGDVCYGYILRDNQIKDYIYYRFAHVYEDIDFNKAKALAYESLQFVDGRYTYYQNIMDIINK
ncbi:MULTISPECIES: neurofilament protein [Bacillota]|uniref:Neurofilament protein n=2 Tax=Amedibacillus TaxID=2749846 RepID=A0A7G9GKA9_9FIRM|nr:MULTISPECIES: neurofilament protein [Bacillota]QNM11241.1 neurofilament protein [[Eubacterium] hominis]MCH4284706.1 neurofilament protein [Amedibacillus hominis]RGB52545.1 neurofilament protein [Absiella sp. AM22-9]RGB54856.1 neurofilament protein [Absiella sp. AM10-20]RGB68133.1 neurofilament protein [Absiella sp. AM09-45]